MDTKNFDGAGKIYKHSKQNATPWFENAYSHKVRKSIEATEKIDQSTFLENFLKCKRFCNNSIYLDSNAFSKFLRAHQAWLCPRLIHVTATHFFRCLKKVFCSQNIAFQNISFEGATIQIMLRWYWYRRYFTWSFPMTSPFTRVEHYCIFKKDLI